MRLQPQCSAIGLGNYVSAWKRFDPMTFIDLVGRVLDGEDPARLVERYGGAAKERMIMYHGTKGSLVKQILSNGLEPFPEKRAWAGDPDASFNLPSRASIGGVYYTTNLMTAISAGRGAAGRQTKNSNAIFVVEVQPRSLIADEDDVLWAGKVGFIGYNTSENMVAQMWLCLKAPKALSTCSDYLDQARREYIDIAINNLKGHRGRSGDPVEIHPKLEARLRDLLSSEGFEAALTRLAAYSGSRDSYSMGVYSDLDRAKVEMPSKSEGEKVYAKFVDKLTKTLKDNARTLKSPGRFAHTARSLTKITTKGSNRIIAVALMTPSEDGGDKIEVVYGKLPQDFIKQYDERIGPGHFDAAGNPV
jgi:hypothetical protein